VLRLNHYAKRSIDASRDASLAISTRSNCIKANLSIQLFLLPFGLSVCTEFGQTSSQPARVFGPRFFEFSSPRKIQWSSNEKLLQTKGRWNGQK
jgi:hypothetical protein